MYVRDHTRPMLHNAMGLHSTEYDYDVFRITNTITKQVFPLTLDIDHPVFRAGLERLFRISQAVEQAKAQGGVVGFVKRVAWSVAGLATFARLYVLPTVPNELPAQMRMQPAW
jgi:magnesium-protoporphyrin IX monomethyl ester (oxidative) cyclase